MKAMLMAAAVLALATPGAAAGDLLAPARAGKTLCLSPKAAARTCRSMVSYSFGPGAAVTTRAQTLVTETAPVIVMSREGPARLRKGAICHKLVPADIDDARFTIGGKAASSAQASDLHISMKGQYADLIGKEFCSGFKAEGSGLRLSTSIDGKLQADVTDTAIWVEPAAGYKVAP